MNPVTPDQEPPRKEKRGVMKALKDFFGGEFLLSRQMRRWYPYLAFVLALMAVMIISEQRIQDKQRKIKKLENEYKAELSKLKANNQFIPYEENQLLIRKMQERGYVLNEEQNYTIRVKREAPEKKHRLFKRKNNEQ